MKQHKKITNESLAAERHKLINSRGYKKSVKNIIQLVKTYQLLDMNINKVMGGGEISKFAHFFSDVMKEDKRRSNRDSFSNEDNNDSAVNAQKERIYVL